MKRGSLLIALSLMGVAVLANTTDTRIGTSEQRPIEHLDTLHERAETARAWGLTAEETTRYQRLMRGPRGAFSVENISPIEVLGIHAQTPAERQQYADRLVRLLYEDTERVLAFERETQAAWQRLGQPLFDPARLADRSARPSIDPGPLWGKRLAVFVATKDCPRCAMRTRELVKLTGDDGALNGLDIYVADTQDAAAIRTFARSVGIAPEAVASRRITLNQGTALFAQYLGDDRDLPKVFVRDGGQLHLLADFVEAAR